MTAFHSLEVAASPAAAVGTAVSPSLLRPSEVKSLERQMVETCVLKQQPRGVQIDSVVKPSTKGVTISLTVQCHCSLASLLGDSSEQLATTSLSNMWGNVVNWMRAAVDFVGLDGMPVAEPSLKAPSLNHATSSSERVSYVLSTHLHYIHVQKLPLQETNDQPRSSKQLNTSRSRRANNRRMSLGIPLHQTKK